MEIKKYNFFQDGEPHYDPEKCKLLYRYKCNPGLYVLVSVYISPKDKNIISVEFYSPVTDGGFVYYPIYLSYDKILEDFEKLYDMYGVK